MIGTLVAIRYEVQALIHDGPIFRLFRARDRIQNRDVNIRFFVDPFDREPAFHEAITNVITQTAAIELGAAERLLELADHEGVPFVVSHGQGGETFRGRLDRLAPYSVPVALSLGVQILEALQAVHGAGIVHGELNANTVLVGNDGRVSLLQPGLWMAYGASRLAGAAALPEIAPYLAPEVSQGRMPSPTSDVYAVGVLLFEVLTGRAPFTGETPLAVANRHLTEPIPSARTLNPQVPDALDAALKRALAKDPAERYPHAKAMLADVRMLQDALRLGQPLKIPQRESAAASSATQESAGSRTEPAPAPRKLEKRDYDVMDRAPAWLSWIAYTFALALLVMVGGWIYWNMTKPGSVPVPNVVGRTLEEAAAALRKQDLILREARRAYDERSPAGTVIETVPAAGQQARQSGVVNAVISAGSRFARVPDLQGMSLDEARATLSKVGMEVHEQVDERRDRRVEPGRILSQLPTADSRAERGTRVRVTVSSRETREYAKSRGTYDLTISMPREGEVVNVRVDVVDAVSERTVYEQRHAPGSKFEVQGVDAFGESVIFKVYYNGELVKQVEKSLTDARPTGEERE